MLIKNGLVIDPKSGMCEILDVLVRDGVIRKIGKDLSCREEVYNAEGKWVMPGFIDLHVHFREPGFEYKETIATGAEAAARGGFTTVCCMANTSPVADSVDVIEYIKAKTLDAAVNVLQFGAATLDMAGNKPADFKAMKQAGIAGISDDGKTVVSAGVYLDVLKKAAEAGLTVFSHCEDPELMRGAIPRGIAEEVIIARDIMLAEEAGASLHICHISTEKSAGLVREAKIKGIRVTCEVTPHHLFLTRDDIPDNDANFKMAPPLRSAEDAAALRDALREGVIDCIATDHAPHSAQDKAGGFEKAANGVIGLETVFPVCFTKLVKTGFMSPLDFAGVMSYNAARILGSDKGVLSEGITADIVIIDPGKRHVINAADFASKARNTPFHGREVCGAVCLTIRGGSIVYKGE